MKVKEAILQLQKCDPELEIDGLDSIREVFVCEMEELHLIEWDGKLHSPRKKKKIYSARDFSTPKHFAKLIKQIENSRPSLDKKDDLTLWAYDKIRKSNIEGLKSAKRMIQLKKFK